MLIEETERTFYRGMIVTATVTKVLEGRDNPSGKGPSGTTYLCRLDNGLEARFEA